MPAAGPPRPLVECDDRAQFDCGREPLDAWFRRHAWTNQLSGASRVNVLDDAESGRIIGYVTLSATQIERAFLPKAQRRNSPDPIPATLLGQLAVDKRFQGRGHAKDLLLFALKASLYVSKSIGGGGVVTHPLDDNLRGFYGRRGFRHLPFDPRHAMIVRMAEVERYFRG